MTMSEPSRSAWISIDALGRQHVARAVDVALEGDRLLRHLGDLGQRHDLEAAGVGEDRPLPAHEAVQAAEPRHPLGAGPQHQVVGVAEDDVGAGLAATWSTVSALTVPAVPTGMKAGVRMSPRGVCSTPVRAAPSVALISEREGGHQARAP